MSKLTATGSVMEFNIVRDKSRQNNGHDIKKDPKNDPSIFISNFPILQQGYPLTRGKNYIFW